MKKRKRGSGDDDDVNTIKNEYSSYQQNDQVTFGVGLSSQVNPFTTQPQNSFIGRGESQRQSGTSGHRGITTALNVGLHAEEMGIVKNNPLLKHFPNLSDNSSFISDNSNSVSEFEDERTIDVEKVGGFVFFKNDVDFKIMNYYPWNRCRLKPIYISQKTT